MTPIPDTVKDELRDVKRYAAAESNTNMTTGNTVVPTQVDEITELDIDEDRYRGEYSDLKLEVKIKISTPNVDTEG